MWNLLIKWFTYLIYPENIYTVCSRAHMNGTAAWCSVCNLMNDHNGRCNASSQITNKISKPFQHVNQLEIGLVLKGALYNALVTSLLRPIGDCFATEKRMQPLYDFSASLLFIV